MTQLIVGGVTLPEAFDDNYKAYMEPLKEQIKMISGRMVEELTGGNVRHITYAYGVSTEEECMSNDLMRSLLSVLRTGGSIVVQYLPDDSDTMITSNFICTKLPEPACALSLSGVLKWHNIEFELREVSPSA